MAQAPEKSEGAFRTIREVADWLAVPTHVLRFWESKFQQIAPVKGAGGRRYYRPEDMRLLGGIKVLLHDQGLTIRGVGQRIDEEGVEPVMAMSPDLDIGETTPPRARRVIRAGDEEDAPRLGTGRSRPGPDEDATISERPAIRREGASVATAGSQPDADPMPEQPDADPMPDQPTDTESAPQPGDGPVHDALTPPQPVDRRPPVSPDRPMRGVEVAAPTEPVVTEVGGDGETDPLDDPDEEIGQLGDPSEDDAGSDDGNDEEPTEDMGGPDRNTEKTGPRETRTVFEAADLRDTSAAAGDDASDSGPRNGGAPASLDPIARRRLRRVIRKLRDMIDDVEQELSGDPGL